MRAVQLQAIGQVGLTTLPDPVPGVGEILIRVFSFNYLVIKIEEERGVYGVFVYGV